MSIAYCVASAVTPSNRPLGQLRFEFIVPGLYYAINNKDIVYEYVPRVSVTMIPNYFKREENDMYNDAAKVREIIESIQSIINKTSIDVHYEHVEVDESEYVYLFEICDLGISISSKKSEDVAERVIRYIVGCVSLNEKIAPKNQNEQREKTLFELLYELYTTNIHEFKKLLKLNRDFTQFSLR